LEKKQQYVLFEVSLFVDLSKVSQMIFDINLKNIIPIFAHPERSKKIQNSPEILEQWLHQGCLMQMNAGSILGQFGKKCQQVSKRLLKAGLIHIISSDAHEQKHRNYLAFKNAFNDVSSNFNVEYANILFKENPYKIVNGGKVKIFNTDKEMLRRIGIRHFLKKLKSVYN